MDSHLRRYDAGADRTSDRDPKHLRSRACQGHRVVVQPGASVPVRRSRGGRCLDRGDGSRRRFAASSGGRILSRCRCWKSIHGIAVHPNSDDVTVEAAPDRIVLGRPGGLTLSSADTSADRAPTAVRPIFDVEAWRSNQQAGFIAREDALISAAAAAEPDRRTPARIDLARFYLSRAMYPEAKGVLDLALAEVKPGLEDPVALIVHSVASTLMGRPRLGLKDLASPAIGTKYDPQLWKALADARLGKWAEAREKFKNAEVGHHRAADRPAADRDIGGDARGDRGPGLFGCGETRQRSANHRAFARADAGGLGVARPARRSARPRGGRVERLQDRR